LLAARISANEAATISTLKSLASAQAQIQASGYVDANGNGRGEFAYFQELSGVRNVKASSNGTGVADSDGTNRVKPPMLSFGTLDSNGLMVRGGYVYRMFLPGVNAVPLGESGLAAAYPAVDAAWAESLWACYAWPTSHTRSGRRVFFINQRGEILQSPNVTTGYSGVNGPAFTAVTVSGSNRMTATIAMGATGADGQRWTSVN